jgi:hypothetical protein
VLPVCDDDVTTAAVVAIPINGPTEAVDVVGKMAAADLTSPDDEGASPAEMVAAALMDEISMFCCLSNHQQK